MTLTSSSTILAALAQYNDNLSWDGDIAKARLALEAVRFLLLNRPQASEAAEHKIEYASLDSERKRLEQFVDAHRTDRASYTRPRAMLP